MEFSGNKSTGPPCIAFTQSWLMARDGRFLTLARSSDMKKITSIGIEPSGLPADDTVDSSSPAKVTDQLFVMLEKAVSAGQLGGHCGVL